MLIELNNSNSNDRGYLCKDCKYSHYIKVKSKTNEIFCKCLKWGTTVSNVGVCKYYRKDYKNVGKQKEVF